MVFQLPSFLFKLFTSHNIPHNFPVNICAISHSNGHPRLVIPNSSSRSHSRVLVLLRSMAWLLTRSGEMPGGCPRVPTGPFFNTGAMESMPNPCQIRPDMMVEHMFYSGFMGSWTLQVACGWMCWDVYLLPSETIGHRQGESFACGLPLIHLPASVGLGLITVGFRNGEMSWDSPWFSPNLWQIA